MAWAVFMIHVTQPNRIFGGFGFRSLSAAQEWANGYAACPSYIRVWVERYR